MVWKGHGLGGGSLVNSNVSIRPEKRIFQTSTWPSEIRNDMASLEAGYDSAWQVLCPNPYPFQQERPLTKMEALKAAGQGLAPWAACDVNVTFVERTNAQGVHQPACTLCGNCNTGCNVGAKNTLAMNYLPDAVAHGATIVTMVEVLFVTAPASPGEAWTLTCESVPVGGGAGVTFTVTADNVVLGAGSIGSSEILLRSKAKGLSCSDRVGRHFGADGDFFGLSYNGPAEVSGVGWKQSAAPGPLEDNVGPCILSFLDFRFPDRPVEENFIVEDMAIPGLAGRALSLLLAALSEVYGKNEGGPDAAARALRELETLSLGPYAGAMRDTLLMGGMAWDAQDGLIALNPQTDGVALSWPDAVDPGTNAERNAALKQCVENLKGVYVENPWANNPFGVGEKAKRTAACVHPLGGCCMADSADLGVTNHIGQVYSGTSGTQVHAGLYVLDGSILPSAVGVNPLFTISAVAERAMAIITKTNGWQVKHNPEGLHAHPAQKVRSDPAAFQW